MIRPKKPTPLPVVLDRHRVYIFPTRQGLLFIVVLIAMLAGSINYNNNLGFLLVFLLGGILLVSMIHTYRNLLGLQVLSVSAAPVFAGDDAVFNVLLYAGRHARKAVSVSAGQYTSEKPDLHARVDEGVPVSVPAQQRGLLIPESFTVSTVYPVGLFSAWSVLRPGSDCTVYPFPKGVFTPIHDPDIHKGGRKSGLAAGADDYKGLKTYQPGDSFRHIAWKALSKGQGLFAKDFGGAARRSVVVFDFSKVGGNDTEDRLSKLCAMILRASRENRRYGLVLPGKTIPPGSGDAHRHRCLKALAVFEDDGTDG